MQKLNDLSRCLTLLEPDSTVIAVIEMSQSSWLVAVSFLRIEDLSRSRGSPSKRLRLLRLAAIDGARKQRRQDTGSHASLSLSRPVGTAFGWRAGSGHATSRPMSFMHRA